jgi:hypothetical protein
MGGGGGGSHQDFTGSLMAMNTAVDQWNNYQAKFVPYQNKLISTIGDPAMLAADQGFARNAVAQAFDTQRGAQERSLSRMGATMTPEQQAASNESMGLAASSQTVAGLNAAAQHTKESDMALMGAGMGLRNTINPGG